MPQEATTTDDQPDELESDIAGLLNELSSVQGDLLSVLSQKRTMLAAGDGAALGAMATRERDLVSRLQAFQDRRQQLLARAATQGLPSDSIKSLSKSLPSEQRNRLRGEFDEARSRSRLLQHECLTNYVLVQRTLLHLSQMIEIIATGGRMKPTYGNGSDRQDQGALVDRAV
ncbi:MAG: flagellar export chaperone FlgN [Pirellulales bacterium]